MLKKRLMIAFLAFMLVGLFLIFPVKAQKKQEDMIENLVWKYKSTKSGFAFGLDPTFFLGAMTKNGFGYPKSSFGISPLLGFDFRNYQNLPSVREVKAIARSIIKGNPDISALELEALLKRRLRPGSISYFQFGTELLLIPKIGFGIVLPIGSYGAMFDIGFCFPLLLNIGFIVTF